MLFEYIERVRNEPKDVRKRTAFFWSAVFTGVIVLVWLSVIIGREYAQRGSTAEQVTDVANTITEDTHARFDAANDFLRTTGDVVPSTSFTPSTFTATTTDGAASSSAFTTTPASVAPPASSTPTTSGAPALWP